MMKLSFSNESETKTQQLRRWCLIAILYKAIWFLAFDETEPVESCFPYSLNFWRNLNLWHIISLIAAITCREENTVLNTYRLLAVYTSLWKVLKCKQYIHFRIGEVEKSLRRYIYYPEIAYIFCELNSWLLKG